MKNALSTKWIGPLIAACLLPSADATGQSNSAFSDGDRATWTTSRIQGSPEPPLPYVTERAFPALQFDRCLDLTSATGMDRLFIVEQNGKIFSFPNRPDVDEADLVLDARKQIPGAEQVYALAFHPEFESNRYCFVCYIKAASQDDGTHVARFKVLDGDTPKIDVESETTIITWLSGGHNGCCLKFGPDGYLYISTGDGEGPNPPDVRRTGQDVSDLLSSILRIDVDHPETGRKYRIPSDNPFVGRDGIRPEIWAYGFRNPWRMSFDRKTGDLWVGDVGWELWELLDRVERGGNYGWSVMEGNQPTNPEWPRGPSPILPPTIEHPHSESSSITDGLTYYGERLKDLHGMHIYGDYDTGKFWGFRFEHGAVMDHRELADTTHRVVGFGEDMDGEFYFLDHTAGTIHQLAPNPNHDRSSNFPRTLSDSGLFAPTAQHLPAPGVVPYEINAEPWADWSVAERFVAIPDGGSIKQNGQQWEFPQDSVLVKTISLAMEQGNPDSLCRLETQLLHFDGIDWQPYTFQWNEEQTDAQLVPAEGAERQLQVADQAAPDGKRVQTWRFAGRAECQRCHNKWSGPPLAFNSAQLDRDQEHRGDASSQLARLAQLGVLEHAPERNEQSRLVDPYDPSQPLNRRARSYLHVNCAHCHRRNAGSAVLSKMRYDLPLEETDMLGIRPTQGTFGIHRAEVIAPADPYRSVLVYRMAKLGGGRMPRLGSTEVDREGVGLICDWIDQLTPHKLDNDKTVAELRQEATAQLEMLTVGGNQSAQSQRLETLLSSTSGAMLLLHSIDRGLLPGPLLTSAVQQAAAHQNGNVRDLFERFLPHEQRSKRLGNVVQPRQIFSLTGDPSSGERLFMDAAGVQCKSCHRVGQTGHRIGPDLSHIGAKASPALLLESILAPSKRIDPQYVTYAVETKDGRLLSGLLVEQSEGEVALKDAQDKIQRIGTDEIAQFVPQSSSLMPDLLFRDMSAQQLADLVAYLSSLK